MRYVVRGIAVAMLAAIAALLAGVLGGPTTLVADEGIRQGTVTDSKNV